MTDAARVMLSSLLQAARLSVPDEVAALLADRGQALGADETTVFLVDHEQYVLVPLPPTTGESQEPLAIDSTLAGRCYRHLELQSSDGGRVVWLPVLNGLERLGVLRLRFPDGAERAEDEYLHAFAALIAEVVMVKDAYGDLFARVRRRRPMSLAAEIAWNLLPPLTFGTERLLISCVLAPAHDVGGDSFDYAVDATTARFAVFDAMGHGLQAGLIATVAIGAYRNARRQGLDLPATVTAINDAIQATFDGERFATAVLAELDLASGRLTWHNAGHPHPLLLRDGHIVKTLTAEPDLPLGLRSTNGPYDAPVIHSKSLEPGDRLVLFTDGVIEARTGDGEFFGGERLTDFIARQGAAGLPAPEAMRQLMHAILAHQEGRLQDDATVVLVEWQTGGDQRVTP